MRVLYRDAGQNRARSTGLGWAGLAAGSLALSMTIWQTATSGNFWPLGLGATFAIMGIALWWPLADGEEE